MYNVGIYCPAWVLAKHNTDHKMAQIFVKLSEFVEIETSLVSSALYTWTFNINRILNRTINSDFPFLQYGMNDNIKQASLIYHYGLPVDSNSFFKSTKDIPTFVTAGFMTDRYVADSNGKIGDRQKEADTLARRIERADMIHFHTEGGRQRFLHYRPEFESKTVAIPFFLPNLSSVSNEFNPRLEEVNISFVGNDGSRKGLFELVEALDLLGHEYLKLHKVKINIISKDKPVSKLNLNINWHKKLPNDQVIDLMRKTSIFVLVPKKESYGLVLIEAMTAGCAIISDDDDTRKEILKDSGVLLPSGTPNQIAKALKLLIEDSAYRAMLGNKAKSYSQKLFSPSVVASQYDNHFRSILN